MVPRIVGTVWASAVSQAPRPGSIVARYTTSAASETAIATAQVAPSRTRENAGASRAATGCSTAASPPGALPAKDLPPCDAPQVDRRPGDQEDDRRRPRPAVAGASAPEGDQRQEERH